MTRIGRILTDKIIKIRFHPFHPRHPRTWFFSETFSLTPANTESQCHAGFEDGDFSVAVLLIVSRVAACNTDDKPDKTVANFPHAFALQKRACIEVDPIRFTVI